MDSLDDQKWTALAAIWQSPADEPNVADLKRELRRRARNANLLFLFDLSQGAIQIGFGIFLLELWTWPSSLVGASLLIFGVFALALAIWSRFGTDGATATGEDDALALSTRYAEAGIRWAISGYLMIGSGILLLLILGYAHNQPDYHRIVPLPYWLKTVFASGYLLFWLWRCTRLLRDNRRLRHGLQAIACDISNTDIDPRAARGSD